MTAAIDSTISRNRPGPGGARSASDFAAADRHSMRVTVLKLGLPLAALFAVGFFMAATIFAGSGSPATESAQVEMADGRIVMANPKMEGFTKNKRPYKMVAERAIQQSAGSSLVELQKISAELPLGGKVTAKLTAQSGLFDSSANTLDLSNDITLVTSDGMIAKLTAAKISIGTNELESDQPVDITTDQTHITADGMNISDGGKVVTFTKRVRLNIAAKK